MKRIKLHLFILIFIASLLTPKPVFADGIIIPDRPIMEQLVIRYHHVDVKITNQLAVTTVDQVFYNPNEWTVEGIYSFPIPKDAGISSFKLWIDGNEVSGKILDADQARQQYEEIVRTMRDPALLEYTDRGAVQVRIFPIASGGERRIQLEYSQPLLSENGLIRYTYPLNTEKFSMQPLESVSVKVDITSLEPIRAVYSPSHTISTTQDDPFHAIAGYEASNVTPDTDFSIYYSTGNTEAFHLFTYKGPDPADPDGFFMLLLAPKPEQPTHLVSKDVILVLDHSGSMDGEKYQQVFEAANFILTKLNPEDHFNIISFSTAAEAYAATMQPASKAAQALTWLEKFSAAGSTDIHSALKKAAAVSDSERPTYLIFLTDGLPTEGITDTQRIIKDFSAISRDNLRFFSFGVGYDVDTVLLDTLSQNNHGSSIYVLPGQPLNEIVSTFYSRISAPVLTDLTLDFGDIKVYDLNPNPLPDLFYGSQILITGRYRGSGTTSIKLAGSVNGTVQTMYYPEQVFTGTSKEQNVDLSYLPGLWATRKIGMLLNQIRINGPDKETIDQIVKLSIRYGIVTPYTSYLVTEPDALGADAQKRIVEEQFQAMSTMPAPAYGAGAVNKAADSGEMSSAEAPLSDSDANSQVKVIGDRTFLLVDGVWTDTRFDSKTMTPFNVSFLSADYFKLAGYSSDVAAALALGEKVILLINGKAYQMVEAGLSLPAIPMP
jgi:Ca-activated chloride channel homolog